MRRHFKLLSIIFLLLCATMTFAQVTTSSMSGRVVSNDEAVIGASVVAQHNPSGTVYRTITNTEGRFNIKGMRVGGPYSVKISYIGMSSKELNGINLQLGQTYPIHVAMTESQEMLNEVVVVGKNTQFTTEKTGASTNISNKDMVKIPTISRGISDITRISPYASGMNFAGSDGRSTNFTVDGANFNNNFGLSSSLPGGGMPISMDAIEEVQVVVSPYDVRQTNFIGGGINAITKSGTNTFKGTAYTYFTNQNLRGNKIGDYDFGKRSDYSKTIYGLTLGGPIIKNKLFFFVNAEYEKEPGQVVTWRPSDDGVSDGKTLSRTKKEDMEKVRKHLMDVYGYDAGSYTDYPGDESNMKFLTRLDWNINDYHKLNLRYNYTKNIGWRPTNGNSNNAGARNRSMNRISQYGMAFSNSIYSMNNIVNSLSAELNSRFSDNISNKFITTYSQIKDIRDSNSEPFPFIDILAGRDKNGVPIIEPYISAGYELFTWKNGVHNNILTVTDNLTYYLDKHQITAGLSYEYQMANNAYMRNGTGYYRYASLDDFLNQKAPIDFALTYGYNGDKNPNAQVGFHSFGGYLQDEWNVLNNLKLTAGIRADLLTFSDNLMRNNAIYNLDFGGRKIDTGQWPTTKVLLSPRAGFTWDVFDDNSLKVRGGTGIFTGRIPLVFFTNMPSNSGMVQNTFSAVTRYKNGKIKSEDPLLKLLEGKMITNVDEMIEKLGLQATMTPDKGALPWSVAAVDPEFKMPQVWKTSIAFDYNIPVSFPFNVTVEGIYTKTINAIMLENWSLKQPDNTWEKFSGSDNRYIYPDKKSISYWKNAAYVLTNTNEGWGAVGNITLKAEPIKNLNVMTSYTYTESQEITGMPGAFPGSAYGGTLGVNGPHIPQLECSRYVVPHKVISSLSYTFPWSGDKALTNTVFSLFYSGMNAGRYSYTYSNDMNGDGNRTDLIYIPSKKGDIKFVSQDDEDAFFKFMEQDKYLSKNKGKYAGAYRVLAPWLNILDLKVAQEFGIKFGQHKNSLEVSLDIINVGNLLNSEWGIPQNMSSSGFGNILNYEGKDSNNVPQFSFNKIKDDKGNSVYPTKTFTNKYSPHDTWNIQFGVKYRFN